MVASRFHALVTPEGAFIPAFFALDLADLIELSNRGDLR